MMEATPPRVDKDYLLALNVADRYLGAWLDRDSERGVQLLTPGFKKNRALGDLYQIFSGLSNPHHQAFEIAGAQRLDKDTFRFQVWLYLYYTGEDPPAKDRPAPLALDVVRTGPDQWLVDNLTPGPTAKPTPSVEESAKRMEPGKPDLSAQSDIQLFLDGREVKPDPPARIEQGRTLISLRFLAEALGAQVEWERWAKGSRRIDVYTSPRTFTPPPFGHTPGVPPSSPDSLSALGAAASLTEHLAARQAATLKTGGPYLVRFELLDLRPLVMYPPWPDLRGFGGDGFQFAVRLYYIQTRDGSPPPNRFESVRDSSGAGRVGPVPPNVEASWYEDITLRVRPVGPQKYEKTTEGSVVKEVVTWGLNGWQVDPDSQSTLQKVDMDRTPYVVHGSFGR